MTDDRYRKIFDDLTRDLFAAAKKHGKRALREAVRDAANGNLLQEEDEDDIPPEDLEYPDEEVWTVPPAPEDEEEGSAEDEHELSDAAEKVLDRLVDRLQDRAEK
mgnify:CR=1 FL=1